MTHLIRIGNSQGIRIPKPLVEQAQLEGKDLKLKLVKEGLLIAPEKKARAGWKEEIEKIVQARGAEVLDEDWLDMPLAPDDEIEW